MKPPGFDTTTRYSHDVVSDGISNRSANEIRSIREECERLRVDNERLRADNERHRVDYNTLAAIFKDFAGKIKIVVSSRSPSNQDCVSDTGQQFHACTDDLPPL